MKKRSEISTRLIVISIGVLGLLAFSGIVIYILISGPKPFQAKCPSLSGDDNIARSPDNQSSSPTNIHIQIDGTPSMQGFVSQRDSRYIRTLRLIDSAAITAFPASVSNYYRFGINREELKQASSNIVAERPDFYQYSNNSQDANIDQAIRPLNNANQVAPEDIYVIVTDLYQNQSQWQAVVNNLKKYYLLKDSYAVGILGIKSEFNGIIYDLGLKGQQLPYRSTDKEATFHPFYVLILGKYENVKKYFDAIKSGSKNQGLNFQDDHFVIFSTHLLQQPMTLEIQEDKLDIVTANANHKRATVSQASSKSSTPKATPVPRPKNSAIFRQKVINDGQVLINFSPEQIKNIERLRIIDEVGKDIAIEYSVSYNPLPYSLPLKPPLRSQVHPDSDFNKSTPKFTPLSSNQSLLQLDNWQIDNDNKLTFNAFFNFNPNEFSQRGVYRFIIDVFPNLISGDNKPYQTPQWWPEWNLGEKDPLDGSKTYNLLPFLGGLSDATFGIIEANGKTQEQSKNQSAIGRFCFVIHKN